MNPAGRSQRTAGDAATRSPGNITSHLKCRPQFIEPLVNEVH